MKLKLKNDYLHYSIGGGNLRNIKLSDISPEDYIKWYNLGYTEFFYVVDDKTSKKKNNEADETKIED